MHVGNPNNKIFSPFQAFVKAGVILTIEHLMDCSIVIKENAHMY